MTDTLAPPSLFDAEPDNGYVRATDPQTSVVASKRAQAATQRHRIACALLSRPWVTADWLAENDHAHQSHRSVWSTRLGGLVRDGFLERGDPVPGPHQLVLSYRLTSRGRAWVREQTRERGAA